MSNIRKRSIFPKALGKEIEQTLKPIYKKHGFAEHRILTEWESIVGKELSNFSAPCKLVMPRAQNQGGTLHIKVASGRGLELQHSQPIILDRIATYFGYRAVEKLRIIQTSAYIFGKKAKPTPHKELTASQSLIAQVAKCEDEDLRKALLSLGKAINANFPLA